MWPYWLIFALPLAGVSLAGRNANQKFAWFTLIALLTLFVGLRFQVGGDWYNYLRHFGSMTYVSLPQVLELDDPAYYVLNWLVANAGLSIAWVNLVCASLVFFGVHRFCASQPLPWLALTVAIPYLLIVVGMGYTRQAAALGLAMAGLTALGEGNNRNFVIWVLVGALFHKSAVLLLPIAALAATNNRFLTGLWVAVFAGLAAYLLILPSAEQMWQAYVVDEYAQASQGGAIRVCMNAVPALILLKYRNRLFTSHSERKLWLWMAVLSLATVPMLLVSPTAVDRVALYFIPLQVFVFSRLPFIASARRQFNLLILGIVAYYALVQFVWLNFAVNAFSWVPYRNYLFI